MNEQTLTFAVVVVAIILVALAVLAGVQSLASSIEIPVLVR